MQFLKADTAATILIGPFLDKGDGVTPEEGITLAAADSAELMKHDGTTFVDLTSDSRTFTHREKGMYTLALGTGDTDTEGRLTIFISDESVCLPVWKDFMVLSKASYDSFFTAKASGYMDINVKAYNEQTATTSTGNKPDVNIDEISDDTTAPGNLELMYDGTGYAGGSERLQVDVRELGDANLAITTQMKADVEAEVTDSLVVHNLDHLCKTATAGADMTTEVPDNTILSRILASGDTSAFDPTTDSLQDNRDRRTGPTKNTALSNFTFVMRLSLDHVSVATGKTVTAQISKDGAAFANSTNSATELSNGVYDIDLTATEMNADVVTLKFTETDCDATLITILTST